MYIKGIEAVFRAILYPESCIGIAFSCEEYSKEYFDEIKRIINKYETRFRSFKKYQPVSFGNFLKVKKYRNFSKKC